MGNVDPGATLVRLNDACARVRAAAAATPEDVLDAVAEQARLLAGARDAWAASLEPTMRTALASVRSTSDENGPPTDVVTPPLASLVTSARPTVRVGGILAAALLGSTGIAEGIVAVKLDGSASRGELDLDVATLDLAIGQLATVAGLVLEGARLRQRVDAVTRARELLLASVSHDLRNPLNTFAMSVGLLRDDLERNDVEATRGIALVSRMERATARMQGMIEDLVEASRIDAHKIDFVVRVEGAAQLVRDAVTAAAPIAAERGASMSVEAVDEGARVMADRARTLQLIAKVIAFETKSTGDGGSIRFGITRLEDSVVFTARALGPGGIQVAVPDEGRGGLALLLARGLVEGQRGSFRIDGSDGLTVAFTLPAAKV